VPAYETTSVPVSRSQEEVRALLQRHGASSFSFGEATIEDRVWVGVEFVAREQMIRLRVPLKVPDEETVGAKARRARTKTAGEIRAEVNEQEARRVWRVIAHNIKARMVAVEEGVESFTEAFMAHLVVPETNRTIYEHMAAGEPINVKMLPRGD
jgi:hypothetical protein